MDDDDDDDDDDEDDGDDDDGEDDGVFRIWVKMKRSPPLCSPSTIGLVLLQILLRKRHPTTAWKNVVLICNSWNS